MYWPHVFNDAFVICVQGAHVPALTAKQWGNDMNMKRDIQSGPTQWADVRLA
jgi:hypothetical protein